MRAILLAAAATLALTSAVQAQPAQPQFQCAERSVFAKILAKQYHETPVAIGLQQSGNLLEIYATKDGKTWTALSTTPDRKSCIVGAGKNWSHVELLLGEPS